MFERKLCYLNAKVIKAHKTPRTEVLTLILSTQYNPLLCVELHLPDPRCEWPMPDELLKVVTYDVSKFIRVAVTDPEGPVVGIGDFQQNKWFDVAKHKGTGPGIVFPKEAPADWDGKNAGWYNMRFGHCSMRAEEYGTRMDVSLYGPGEEIKLDARYIDAEFQQFGADFRTVCKIAGVSSWGPDGRFVRVRKIDDQPRRIAFGHLFEDVWTERFS